MPRVPGGLHGGQDRLDAFANDERITISGLSEANHAAFDTAERHSLLVPGDRSLAGSVKREEGPLSAGHAAVDAIDPRNDRRVAHPARVPQRRREPQASSFGDGEAAVIVVGLDHWVRQRAGIVPKTLGVGGGAHCPPLGRMPRRSSAATMSRKLQPAKQ